MVFPNPPNPPDALVISPGRAAWGDGDLFRWWLGLVVSENSRQARLYYLIVRK